MSKEDLYIKGEAAKFAKSAAMKGMKQIEKDGKELMPFKKKGN